MAAGDHEVESENRANVRKPQIILQGGASLVQFLPVFSNDSKRVFVCCGYVIKVLSVASGECIRELSAHQDLVTSVHLNPNNHLQLFSSSLDKTIIQWDFNDGIPIKVYHVPFAVHRLLYSSYSLAWLALVRMPLQENELVELTLLKEKADKVPWQPLVKDIGKDDKKVAMGCRGRFIAAVQMRSLVVYFFKKKSEKRYEVEKAKSLTCVACHPTESCIATGCADGNIVLWWNFMKESKVIKTCLHWHSLAVETLTFTTEGSYLLSGGHECVLVKWQHNSQHRDFLPRVGAAITHVSAAVDGTLYALCTADNMIQILSSNFHITQCHQGLTQGHSRSQYRGGNCVPAGLHYDKRTSALITNGRPGHLQFYSIHNDQQLFNLDIVGQNFISADNLLRAPAVCQVERAALGGIWLATLERRPDDLYTEEMALKFWLFEQASQKYVLNTIVDLPHQKKVNTLLLRPSAEGDADMTSEGMALTTSLDGQFKLWSLVEDTDIYRRFWCWQCESVGFYRDLAAYDASFSQDGSLLAVVFGQVVTLWDPDTNALRTTLSSNEVDKQNIRQVEFGRGACQHYLVVTSCSRLQVWDMLQCSVSWSVDIASAVLVADVLSDIMAVFTEQRQLYVFRPSESKYLYSKKNMSHSDVVAAIFIPRNTVQSKEESKMLPWQSHSQLYYMNEDQNLLTITLPEPDITKNLEDMMDVAQNIPRTPFSLLMAQKQVKLPHKMDETNVSPKLVAISGSASVNEMLQTPTHVLPPVYLLCSKFVQALLIDRNNWKHSKTQIDDSSSDEDERLSDMMNESDSDVEVDEPTPEGSNILTETQQSNKHHTTAARKMSRELKTISSEHYNWLSVSIK